MSSESRESVVHRGLAALLAKRRALLAEGYRAVGWKAAFGSAEAKRRLGLPHLLVGFLTDRSVVPSGTVVSVEGWRRPVVEPEVAVRLRDSVRPGSSPEAVAEAVGELGPALELADVHRPPEEDLEAVAADNIFHRYAVVGEMRPVAFLGSLAGRVGRVFRKDSQVAVVDDLEAVPGRVVDVLAEMARVLAGLGEALCPGDLVICGSVIPPLFLEPGDESVGFHVDGLGAVSVRVRVGDAKRQ